MTRTEIALILCWAFTAGMYIGALRATGIL